MKPAEERSVPNQPIARSHVAHLEHRQWWLSFTGVAVTLCLTLGIVSFSLSNLASPPESAESANSSIAVRALVGMVLLFDVFVIFQQFQIYRFRKYLAEREELFSLITENVEDMIAVVTADGKRIYNSPSYQRVLGYSPQELAQTSSFEQIHAEDRQAVISAAEETKRTGTGRRVEYRMRHKNGEWRVLESTANAVRDDQGTVEQMVIVNRDITDRKQLEQQLYLSQKLEAVGRLSGGIAHDFNNLLGVIIGYSETILRRIGPDDPFREPVDEIKKAGQRAAALTKQLLAFSRKQVLEPKILDLNVVVAEVEKMLRRLIGEDIDLQVALSADLGRIKADRGQIEQVILNLAVNSRDAMPRGGKLMIETTNADIDEQDAKVHRYAIPGHYVVLKVTDNGCGMDAAVVSHIFEPFFTTKELGKGTGLGLATVYGVIKQSGGYIWVDSEPGKGATFRIYLPRVEGVMEKTSAGKPTEKQPQRSRTILLVEDEPALRKLTRESLKESGYTVLEAKDALEAIEVSDKPEYAFDLLLTDIVMPGMDGLALSQKLLPTRPGMKVIYMSGYTDGATATHGVLESGISILRKPFTYEELLRTVECVLANEKVHEHV